MPFRIRSLIVASAALIIPFSQAAALNDPMFCGIKYQVLSQTQTDVQLSFSTLAAGAALPYAFHWNFGDGGSSSLREPVHTFTGPGIFTVELTVTGSGGPSPVCRDSVLVAPGIAIDPMCRCAAAPTWGIAPLPVDFHGDPAFGDPTSWHWDFGDGATSDFRDAQHIFPAGTYFVALTGIEGTMKYLCTPSDRSSLRVTSLPPDAVGVAPVRPSELSLAISSRNPSAGEVRLAFELPRRGRVRLTVLDLAGRRLATLVDEFRDAGRHAASWLGRADRGQVAAAGVYLALLEYEGASRSVRIVQLP